MTGSSKPMHMWGGCGSKRIALLMTWTLGVERPRCFRISTITSVVAVVVVAVMVAVVAVVAAVWKP